jgi:hypothetical protein
MKAKQYDSILKALSRRRRLPAQMVQAHPGFDKATLAEIPDGKLVIV